MYEVGKKLGHDRIIELATDPSNNERQLSWLAPGDGSFTSGIIEELSARCSSAPARVEPYIALWEEVDTESWRPMGATLTADVQFGTDKIIKALARCTGNCDYCVFAGETLTLKEAMGISLGE